MKTGKLSVTVQELQPDATVRGEFFVDPAAAAVEVFVPADLAAGQQYANALLLGDVAGDGVATLRGLRWSR